MLHNYFERFFLEFCCGIARFEESGSQETRDGFSFVFRRNDDTRGTAARERKEQLKLKTFVCFHFKFF